MDIFNQFAALLKEFGLPTFLLIWFIVREERRYKLILERREQRRKRKLLKKQKSLLGNGKGSNGA